MRTAMSVRPAVPPSGELPPPCAMRGRTLHNVRVPMRDGVTLAMDVVMPDLSGPRPVVLTRTPYDKVSVRESPMTALLIEQGFVVAVQDCRGRFNSEGTFRPFFDEADDGFDTVEWLGAQPWCDGNVGMTGTSYGGVNCWWAASRRPANLRAIAPFCSPPSTLWRNEPVFNGCFLLPFVMWTVAMGERAWAVPDFIAVYDERVHRDYYDVLPLAEAPRAAGVDLSWWDELMSHPTYDDYWKRGSYGNHDEMDVAVLHTTGWWDMNFPGAPLNFEAMKDTARGSDQRLVIGPWPHWVNRHHELNGVDLGEQAVIELREHTTRFFRHWLMGENNGTDRDPPVHVYVVGANEWWAEESWPLPDTEYVTWWFRSDGHANSHNGDGRLSLEPPAAEPADHYRYDPADVPVVIWQVQDGPVDDREVTARADCVCYTSDPLDAPLDVVGWVTAHLVASSSALDTDWHVRLVDVQPDGSTRFLCHGALRARFRESVERAVPLTPDEPTAFTISLNACGVRFQPGHRIRIEVASAWFGHYARNANTWSDNFFTAREIAVADQRIFHEDGLASYVVLPVIPPRPAR